MKITRSRIARIWPLLALSLLLHGEVCFGQDKGGVSMNTQISQAEDSWKRGDRSKYYSKVAAIAEEIKANSSKTNLNGPAAKLLGSLLSKQVNPAEVEISDLLTMKKVAAYLVSNDDVSIEDRRANVRLLCKYLGKVNKERVPNFKPKRVVENVPPPPGVPGMAGMSPDAIKDPIARAKYERAIRENRQNNAFNSRQAELGGMEWAMRDQLKDYMLKTFTASDVSTPTLIQCMSDAGFDDQERKEIKSQLKRTGGK